MPTRKKLTSPATPPIESDYWRQQYATRPYYTEETDFESIQPAYEYGESLHSRFGGKSFEEAEDDVRAEWEKLIGSKKQVGTRLGWEQARPAIQDAYERTLQLAEEELHVEKEQVKTGEVKIRKEVRTEVKTIDVPIEHEEVVIERRPARGKSGAKPVGKSEEIRIPVSEEQISVTKTPVVKEEVTVRKRKVQEKKQVSDTVRSEEAVIDQEGKAEVMNDAGVRRRKK